MTIHVCTHRYIHTCAHTSYLSNYIRNTMLSVINIQTLPKGGSQSQANHSK